MNRVDCIKLIRSFIDEKLDGNIENFLNYDLDQLENDEKYGGFDPDNSKIANAIYVVLWGDKIPDLNYDALGTSYRGDILNSFNTLMGRSTEDQTNFVGIQKYTDNPQIIEMAKEYHKKYHTIGNMTIWPNNSVEYSEIWKEYEDDDTRNDFKGKSFTFNTIRSQSPWYDYFDAFLEIIKEQLTAPKIYLNGSAYSVVCELMYGKTLETQFFEDFFYLGGMEKFENFIHTFYYENYVDMENMEIQQIFSPHAYHWRNSYKKEEYEKYVSSYITILIGIVAVGFIIVVLILNGYDAVKYRCPACKKFNGLSYVSSKLLREDDISIQVQNQIKNAEGKVIGTQDQYIPGKRKMYEETYKCANCGYVNKKLVTKDVKLL